MKEIIPKHIQIETVNGMCTARCTMCTWGSWARKPEVMDNGVYRYILEKLQPHREHIQYITLHGCGEPLLDRGLAEKIKIAKEMGFRGTGFATNGTELDRQTSRDLIEAGLDTIICSIDGINKDTHEAIRVKTDFREVVSNVENFIKLRNESGETRVIVRFIRQKLNEKEWSAFLAYWSERIDGDRGDKVLKFDVHNWGDKLDDYQSRDLNRELELDGYICEEVFEKMMIYSDGDLALCCADDNGFFDLGNAIDSDPIEIYNSSEILSRYRETMSAGRISELEHCKTCTIPRSRSLKTSD